MNKFLIPTLLFLASCGQSRTAATTADIDSIPADTLEVAGTANAAGAGHSIPTKAARLMAAYPDNIKGFRNDSLVMADGSTLLFDDGKQKDFVEMLDNSDPEDILFVEYNTTGDKPKYLEDAGRSRSETLFRKMYGQSQAEASRNLTTVDWFGQKLKFTSVNGAADSLRAVAADLAKHPELHKYLTNASTYYWRNVRGAKRLSAHSYGIAIDINTGHSDYWLWKYAGRKETDEIGYVNRIPREVVEAFERHGFIWGGRWYHFDTMHFEYRPEFYTESNKI